MDYSQMMQSAFALVGGLIVCFCFAAMSKTAKNRNKKRQLEADKMLLAEQYKLYLDKAMEIKSNINSILAARLEQHKDSLSISLYYKDLVIDIRKRYVSDRKMFLDKLWALQLYIVLFKEYPTAVIEDIQNVPIDDNLIEYIFDYHNYFDFKMTYTKSTIEEMIPTTGVQRLAQKVWLIQAFACESLEIKKRYDEITTHMTRARYEYSVDKFDYEKAMKRIESLTLTKHGHIC